MVVPMSKISDALDEVHQEIIRAKTMHPGAFNNPHEGWAVIFEELDELWDEVKKKRGGRDDAARKEAIQIAAMAIRYATELC